nr:MAG TPA: Protein of unknown function (DUF551) [Caudoviricetes sp.]
MRLIDADELKGKAIADPDDGEYFVYCQDIDEAPTVDAVPVARFQEREKAVVQLRKKWQAAEMFICTMCGHFDYSIDGNIVYGNKDCGEIVGYPYCKKYTPWIPCSERPPKKKGCYLVAVKHWYDGKPVTREAFWNGADWLSCEKRMEITPRVTHWMPLPEPPKEEDDETIDG